MIYLAVSNFNSSIVPKFTGTGSEQVSIESSPYDLKSIDVSLWHFASKAPTRRGKGSFDARPTDLIEESHRICAFGAFGSVSFGHYLVM